MLIPSIDLMNGKIVQLVQGECKALEFDDFQGWITRFAKYPAVQLIDLDAAKGTGNNTSLVREFARRLPCQLGGGIRTVKRAAEALAAGAKRVIIGSALVRGGQPDRMFAQEAARAVGIDRLVFAVDSKNGHVAVRGWRDLTNLTPEEMMAALEPWCGAFLYTNIDTEGMMLGIPKDTVRRLRAATGRQLIVAGGIATRDEVDQLHDMGVDAVVGMAIYTGKLGSEDGTPTEGPA